jgi:Salmonella virulence plasmid 65kDa B protein/Insecticide toxin TcdB middle/C-terminal region/Insecticide toxin TcdB middle/N-terminal region/FG-GAP-like repeat
MANLQAENKSNQSQFLKTDGGKTKSNSIEIPTISLPKGGGAIKGIDEKFSVNAVNGTASFSIPLPFSPARGLSPSLSLSYNSGAGNGIFGLGWSLGLASIKRKTDKGLPQYLDFDDTDTFLFSEAEDLVPEFKKELDSSFSVDLNGDFIKKERDSDDNAWKIRSYKPRIEGLFAKIERWTEKTTGCIKWRITSKENVTTLLGWSNKSVIADAQNSNKIYEWLPEFVFDDKGNCVQYIYLKEDEKGINKALVHNKNRLDKFGKITYSNTYLEKILYGNKTPYKQFNDVFPAENNYFFETKFDYGEYDANEPFTKIKDWDFRPDAFSDYKAGFEIRTSRLCRRVLLYHHFTGVNEYDGLVKATNFAYDTSNQGFAFLKKVSLQGFIKKNDGTYTSKKLPETEFDYQTHDWNNTIKTIASEAAIHAPTGLDEQQYQFTDLYNEGLSGILSEQANAWFYKHNLGNGNFTNAKIVHQKPSFAGLGAQLQLVDLGGDGGKQLVSYDAEPRGYFELNDENDWQAFTYFENLPNINFGESNTRMLDLDGDGKPEILISEDNVFTWYQADGRKGFLQEKKAKKSLDEENGPHFLFADANQTIFLADMSGDGLTDIVRIRNGEVCYWANLGFGKFGTKTMMDNAPKFDNSDAFNPTFIRLADIDGSGTSDIIYLGKNKFSCYLNLSGNAFATQPFEIEAFPDINKNAKITVTDLLGNGVPCIVWSSNLEKNARAPLKYIDLMNSKKPHIMVFYKNNMGKEVSIEYSPSTKYYIDDKLAGKPWVTKLHFPVQCVAKTETIDKITGWRYVAFYQYHHGYFDHAEKEFRGFGMVEQTDTEHFENWEKGNASNIVDATLHQAPVLSKSWFHTGAYLNRDKILSQFANDYWFEEMKRQGIAVVNNEVNLPDAQIVAAEGIAATYIQNLSEIEKKQAFRACKNMALRTEIFALDAPILAPNPAEIKKQITPYNVGTHNCVIELLQPKGKNNYAIYIVKESESITYNYERNTDDPRIAHNLNLRLDKYGNVLESAAVVYPRILVDNSLPTETKAEQAKMSIIFKENKFTNDILSNEINRIPLPSESKTYELKGVSKTKSFYLIKDFENILAVSSEEIYQNFDTNPTPGTSQKRLIEHIRTNYYNNNLNAKLALGMLESLAIQYESYQLAFTPVLLTDIFGTKVNDAILTEGKFVHSENDLNWWKRSGTTQYIDGLETAIDAQNRFFTPKSHTDPFGTKNTVKYSKNLFVEETEDELLNKTKVNLFNYRTLSPQILRDINNNISEVKTDELGMVKAMAIFGKGNEADDLTGILQETEAVEQTAITSFFSSNISTDLTNLAKNLLNHATVRFLYDFDRYKNTGKPAVVASISREEHFQQNNNSPLQITFEYSNGMGTVAMKKVQAEPGLAKKLVMDPNGISYTIADENTAALLPKQLRWIANGRTIVN